MSAVTPLLHKALNHLAFSNILNPLPYKLRYVEDMGSIRKTMEAAFLFDRDGLSQAVMGREKLPIRPLYDRILRKTAFIISTIAAVIFIPPVGVLYHLSMAVSLLALNIIGKLISISNIDCSLKKIGQHLKATGNEIIFRSLWDPIGFWTECIKERAGILKSISFRNELGIVTKSGGLCTWDIEDDKEVYSQSQHYETLYLNFVNNLLSVIKDHNKLLPKDSNQRLSFVSKDTFSVDNLIDQLENLKKNSPKLYKEHLFTKKIAHLKNLDNSLTYFLKILVNCHNSQVYLYEKILTPKYAFDLDILNEHFDTPESTEWENLAGQTKTKLDMTRDAPSDAYEKIRKFISKNAIPEELFEVAVNTSASEIRKKFFRFAQSVHPDKCKPEFKEEAEALYKFVQEAKNQLIGTE